MFQADDQDFSCGVSVDLSTVQFDTEVGTDYFVVVRGFSSAEGDFELNLSIAPPMTPSPTPVRPENDSCDEAITIAPGDTLAGSNEGASDNRVWYKVVGTGEPMIATTCSANTNFDTVVEIYSGDCADPLLLTSNDQDSACGVSPNLSTVQFDTLDGIEYFVVVRGFAGNEGDFELNMSIDLSMTMSPTSAPQTCNFFLAILAFVLKIITFGFIDLCG